MTPMSIIWYYNLNISSNIKDLLQSEKYETEKSKMCQDHEILTRFWVELEEEWMGTGEHGRQGMEAEGKEGGETIVSILKNKWSLIYLFFHVTLVNSGKKEYLVNWKKIVLDYESQE